MLAGYFQQEHFSSFFVVFCVWPFGLIHFYVPYLHWECCVQFSLLTVAQRPSHDTSNSIDKLTSACRYLYSSWGDRQPTCWHQVRWWNCLSFIFLFAFPFFARFSSSPPVKYIVLPPSINQTSRKPVCHFLYSFTSFGLSLLLIYFSYPPYCLLSLYLFLFLSYYVYVCFCLPFIPFFFICSSSFPSSSLHSISYYHNHIYFKPFLFLCLKFIIFDSFNYPWMAQMQGNFVKYVK